MTQRTPGSSTAFISALLDCRILRLPGLELPDRYGSGAARDRLLERVRQWVDLGMPAAASFALCVYPAQAAVPPGPDEWLVARKESKFLWSLSGMIGG